MKLWSLSYSVFFTFVQREGFSPPVCHSVSEISSIFLGFTLFTFGNYCKLIDILTCSYTVKQGSRFSRPQPGCHLPNSPWPGKVKLFPASESLVSDIPVGDGKTVKLFLQCINFLHWITIRDLFFIEKTVLKNLFYYQETQARRLSCWPGCCTRWRRTPSRTSTGIYSTRWSTTSSFSQFSSVSISIQQKTADFAWFKYSLQNN